MAIDPELQEEHQPKVEIWRELDRAQGDLLGRRYWESTTFAFAVQLLGIWALAMTLFLDARLLIGPLSDGLPSLRFLVIIFMALTPVTLFGGWLVNFQLSLRTPRDRDRPAWLRSLRFIIVCIVPCSPLLAPPLWKELLLRNPTWAAPRPRRPFHIDLRSLSEDLPRRPNFGVLYSSLYPQVLAFAGTLWGMAGIGVLIRSEGQIPVRITLAVSVLAHVLAFLCSRAMLDSAKVRSSCCSLTISISSFILLLPSPLSLLALIFFLPATPRRTLVDSAYLDLTQARRLLRLKSLEHAVRKEPERLSWTGYLQLLGGEEPPQEPVRVSAKRAALFRLKTLFLIPEAGLLSWFATRHSGIFGTDDKALTPFLVGAFMFALAGVFVQLIPPLAQGLRWKKTSESLAPYLIGGYLLLPAAAFLSGWAGGLLLAGNRIQDLILFLDLAVRFGVLMILIHGIFQLRNQRFDFGVLLVWGFLVPILFTLLIRLSLRSEHASLGPLIAATASCLGIISGIFLGGALLYPFAWSDLRAPRILGRTQIALATLALTAILPLGGLAIPFWIWSQQRLWRWYKRDLFAENE